MPSSLAALLLTQDPAVYDMICRADTVGVFQIESRAQMSMLPRLRPRCFYDLVIEVAIVRPGPIQGNMVHPYLRRRMGKEAVTYPSEAVRRTLEKTLGVPLFQEQAMQLAIDCAGFTPDEADRLRRAVTGFRRYGDLEDFQSRFITGMTDRGYERAFAEQCFEQIKGFSSYGFPESHSASFALLVYASAWLKCHHPAAFACALLNSQPMGFYAPAQIVQDAQRHGVAVRAVDVGWSEWECSLEGGDEAERDGETERRRDEVPDPEGSPAAQSGSGSATPSLRLSVSSSPSASGSSQPALRLGMNRVKGLREDEARRIAHAVRRHGPFASIEALWRAAGVSARAMRLLARADAFGSMGLDRQSALWHARKLCDAEAPLFDWLEAERDGEMRRDGETKRRRDEGPDPEGSPAAPSGSGSATPPLRLSVSPSLPPPSVPLPPLPELRHVIHDYGTVGLSLRAHPISFLRPWMQGRRAVTAAALADGRRFPSGRGVTVGGLCLVRQRPGTARGITFMTIEDETGVANLVVHPATYDRFRPVVRAAGALLVRGRVDRAGEVVHVVATSLESMDDRLESLRSTSRDFH